VLHFLSQEKKQEWSQVKSQKRCRKKQGYKEAAWKVREAAKVSKRKTKRR